MKTEEKIEMNRSYGKREVELVFEGGRVERGVVARIDARSAYPAVIEATRPRS